jgi:hypothetical protein
MTIIADETFCPRKGSGSVLPKRPNYSLQMFVVLHNFITNTKQQWTQCLLTKGTTQPRAEDVANSRQVTLRRHFIP